MNFPYPFIYRPEKKKEPEQLPLYIEIGPPLQKEEVTKEQEKEYKVIIIEL